MGNLNRRQFLSLAAGGSVAAAMSLAGCDTELAERRAAAKRPPNIIFLVTDETSGPTLWAVPVIPLSGPRTWTP
jgi:hypothetical protein